MWLSHCLSYWIFYVILTLRIPYRILYEARNVFLIEYCARGSLTLHILWKIMRLTCYIFIENCLWGSLIGWTRTQDVLPAVACDTCTDSSVVDELKFTSVQLTLWPSCQQLCGILDNLSSVVCEATISMSSPVLCVKLQSECPLQCCVWGVMLV